MAYTLPVNTKNKKWQKINAPFSIVFYYIRNFKWFSFSIKSRLNQVSIKMLYFLYCIILFFFAQCFVAHKIFIAIALETLTVADIWSFRKLKYEDKRQRNKIKLENSADVWKRG